MMIEIKNKYMSIGLLPELGASIAYLRLHSQKETFSVLRETPENIHSPNELSGYFMMPWAGKIDEGGFTFNGTFFPMSPDPKMNHNGNAWHLPWDVLMQTETNIGFGLDSSELAPFDYNATVEYSLNEQQLEIRLALTHMGDVPVPYGLGFLLNWVHSEKTKLKAYFTDIGHTNAQAEKPKEADLYKDAKLLAQQDSIEHFLSSRSEYLLTWEDLGYEAHLINSAQWQYSQLQTQENDSFLTLEIASHATNAHHHKAPKESGLVWLENGQTLATRIILSFKELPSSLNLH